MKHAISIIAIVCLSACATPKTQPPSQPAPTAETYPAETKIIDEQLAKQLYWYRDEKNQKEVETMFDKPLAEWTIQDLDAARELIRKMTSEQLKKNVPRSI